MLAMVVAAWFIFGGMVIALYSWRQIIAAWLEPVLSRPVMILESDDWGAGPVEQGEVLDAIARLLSGFKDCGGRRPVMTLGIILATADGEKIGTTGSYHRRQLSVNTHGPLLDAINKGVESGVFDVQLHGMEHFWPPALLAASKIDESVNAWLQHAPDALTEDLPSPLQSRWVDASTLPARSLSRVDVQEAVHNEVAEFRRIFSRSPRVAVPPTFVWTDDVEQAWSKEGIGVVVTPGWRYETRDGSGKPVAVGKPIYNGKIGNNGIVFVARNIYFEPALGHTAAQAQAALASKTELGQPALFEIHRFNFLAVNGGLRQSLEQVSALLQGALAAHPSLAFLSTERLAGILKTHDPEWIEQRLSRRLHVWLTRLRQFSRLHKLAWLTGWILPAYLLWKLTA